MKLAPLVYLPFENTYVVTVLQLEQAVNKANGTEVSSEESVLRRSEVYKLIKTSPLFTSDDVFLYSNKYDTAKLVSFIETYKHLKAANISHRIKHLLTVTGVQKVLKHFEIDTETLLAPQSIYGAKPKQKEMFKRVREGNSDQQVTQLDDSFYDGFQAIVSTKENTAPASRNYTNRAYIRNDRKKRILGFNIALSNEVTNKLEVIKRNLNNRIAGFNNPIWVKVLLKDNIVVLHFTEKEEEGALRMYAHISREGTSYDNFFLKNSKESRLLTQSLRTLGLFNTETRNIVLDEKRNSVILVF